MNNSLNKFLWLCFAITMPLFGVNFLRIEYFDFTISIPLIIIGLIIIYRLFNYKNIFLKSNFSSMPSLTISIWLFFCWHLVSAMQADETGIALKEIIKILMGIIFFYSVFSLFPKDILFLGKFWLTSIWSMSVMLAFLIYVYAFIFNSPFLGSNLDHQTNSSRNQLAWVLTLLYPFALTYCITGKHRLGAAIPLIIFTTSLIYMGSRGAWVATVLGIGFIVLLMVISSRKIWQFCGIILIILPLISGGLWSLEQWAIDSLGLDLNYKYRFLSLFGQEELGAGSMEMRKLLINSSLEAFASSPLIGIGLTNFRKKNDLNAVSHNDWLNILSEMGIIGFLIFSLILLIPSLNIMLFISKKYSFYYKNYFHWIFYANAGSLFSSIIYFNFINTYSTAFFWLFFSISIFIYYHNNINLKNETEIEPINYK